MKSSTLKVFVILACMTGGSGCLPAHLSKYRQNQQSTAEVPNPESPLPSEGHQPESMERGRRPTIYATDKQTFRFQLKEADVWNGALDVLMRNYNIAIVDRSSGVITTEWDSYYLNGEVYRNKVSMRLARSSWNAVDVTIHNNVEKLRDAAQAAGTVGAVWLPADDHANEVARLVQNMALVLRQPPPMLPPGMTVAKDIGEASILQH